MCGLGESVAQKYIPQMLETVKGKGALRGIGALVVPVQRSSAYPAGKSDGATLQLTD